MQQSPKTYDIVKQDANVSTGFPRYSRGLRSKQNLHGSAMNSRMSENDKKSTPILEISRTLCYIV